MRSIRNFGASAIVAACSLCAACARAPQPHTLSIAAAADLQFALEEASRSFHQAHPDTQLRVAYGSSGNFYAQIRNGAPFDLFLSADAQYPRTLAHDGLAAGVVSQRARVL